MYRTAGFRKASKHEMNLNTINVLLWTSRVETIKSPVVAAYGIRVAESHASYNEYVGS